MPDTIRPLRMRPFRLSDADAIAPWLSGPGLSLPAGASRSRWPMRLVGDARIVALVAVEGRQRVGLVRLDCGPDGVAEITLVVDPARRRQGHGRRIFTAALQRARQVGIRRLVAWVDLNNAPALDFFAEHGFESSGVSGSRIRMDRLVHAGDHLPPLDVGV